jgi:zinc protease
MHLVRKSTMTPFTRQRRWLNVVALAATTMGAIAVDVIAADPVQQRLANGLRVQLAPSEIGKRVALVVLYDVGGDHDPAGASGLAHLTEHLYITSAAGDVPARTAEQLMAQYPQSWNAQTGMDYTVFSTVFAPEHISDELHEAAARMADLKPTQAELDREKGRLLQEVSNMFGGFLPLAALNHARSFVRPAPAGHRHGGMPDQVRKISLEQLRAWWQAHYKPANATIIVAGRFDVAEVSALIKKHFGVIPSGTPPPAVGQMGAGRLGQLDTIVVDSSMPQALAQACIAVPAPEPGSAHYAATLVIINRMWMQAMQSRNRPQVIFNMLDDPSTIAVSAAIEDGQTPKDAIEALRAFIAKSSAAPLKPDDATAVKMSLGHFLGISNPPAMYIHNIYGVAFGLGRRMQLNLDGPTLAAAFDAMTPQQFQAGAAAVFGPERQAAVVIAPR